MPFLVGASCLLAVSLLPRISNAQSPREKATLRFTGEVQRGHSFEKDIGKGLVFRLAPDDAGWDIEVGPPGSTDDYTDCANMPAHGITNRQIQGWHFRTDDNTGPRKPDDFVTPGIGEAREFEFVLTAVDESTSCDDLDKALAAFAEAAGDTVRSPIHDENNRERPNASARFPTPAEGTGSMTITSMTLGNLVPGQQAWIESMKFEVSISLPGKQNSKKTAK